MNKLSTFVCSGCGIGEALDLDGIAKLAAEGGSTSCTTHACLCSPEGVAQIQASIDDETEGVLIAACSSREKVAEFSFDTSKVATERVSLREQVAWTQEPGHEDTQMLAEDLVRMGLAKLSRKQLAVPPDEQVEQTVLVVGGGLTGLNAALASAGMGATVELIESGPQLGGYLASNLFMVPSQPSYDSLSANELPELIAKVEAHPQIHVHASTNIERISGQPGQFEVHALGPDGASELTAGAIVQATGAKPYPAERLGHLGYGGSPNVITTQELERMLVAGKLERPSDGAPPKRLLFVQCAGSRDTEHLAYCSAECCSASLRQIATIHREHPDVECVLVYKDLRTPGQEEHFYEAVQSQPGSLFTRGEVESVSGNGTGPLRVAVHGSLLGEDIELESDLVVLATGMLPNSADGEALRSLHEAQLRAETADSETQRSEAAQVAKELEAHEGTEILNLTYRQGPDLPTLGYGFPDSHYICFPYETRRTGIFAAGAVRAPMSAAQAAEDGWGAAMKAVQCIASAERGEAVHPRAGDYSVADFALDRCTQCKRCTEECPFGAIDEDEKGTPEYNALRCRRCGICFGACPERIISFPDYSVDGVASAIKAVEVPDEDEEKPRILVFACENDALPAIDEAARHRSKWNAWLRVIPVRCLGAVNTVWIADSLSSGFDGVMLLGCKRGDDYQCHYIKGSELAATRMANQQDTLDRLALESERIQVVELARDEFHRIPELFEEFAARIEEVGPNPYKDF